MFLHLILRGVIINSVDKQASKHRPSICPHRWTLILKISTFRQVDFEDERIVALISYALIGVIYRLDF